MKRIFSILFAVVLVVSLMMIPAALVGANPDLGLVGEWHFNEGTGTTASDNSGNGNTGTLTNGPTWVSGKFGNALDFDGSDDYVQIANESNFDFDKDDEFTIEAYVQTDSNEILNIVTKMANSAPNTGYQLIKHDSVGYDPGGENKLYFFLINAYNTDMIVVYGSTDIADGLWHHVAVTYDGSATAGGVQIYVDGTPETMYTRDSSNTLSGSILNDLPLQISGREGANYAFDGIIDEVRIWDVALTADEIPALASPTCVTPPEDLVSWWPGDGDAVDIVGNNDGTLQGGASFGVGKVLQAFTFDGDGDAVRFGDVLDDVIAGSDKEFTIDLWVQANSMPDGDPGATVRADLFAKLGDSVVGEENQRQISLILRPDGSLDFVFYGSLDGSSIRLVRASTKLVTGSWYHVAVVYDGPVDTNDGLDRVQMYINGNAEAQTMVYKSGTLGDIPNGNANLSIGAAVASNLNVGYSLDGNIDEVEIFNRALLASEIQDIYNAGSAGKCKEVIIEVDIDIKPGSDPNSINPNSKGVIPVAILTTPDFDATTVDASTVTFGPGAATMVHKNAHLEDVDSDGDIDMVLHFKTQDTGISAGDTEATLTGETVGGQVFEGMDTVNIVPKGKGKK